MDDVTLKDKCCIVGVGHTAYVRGTDRSAISLQVEAAMKALGEAGLTPKDVDGVVPYVIGDAITAEQVIAHMGLTDVRLRFYRTHGASSLIASLQEVAASIVTGQANCVLVLHGRTTYSGQRVSNWGDKANPSMSMPFVAWMREFEIPFGHVGTAHWFGVACRRHMHEYGTTSRDLGALAVAFRKHASLNPHAIMRTPITIDDHQRSRMLVDPFRLLDFSLENDGAAAFVVTSAERANDLAKQPIYIMGVSAGHSDNPYCFTDKKVMTEMQGVARAAKRAFRMAGVTPQDIDVAEVMDGLSYTALCVIEDVGFCKKGEGGSFVQGGRIELGGALPVNTHGGALSECHMGGLNHAIEAVRQLRGECGPRNVPDAELALVATYGDFGEGGLAILRK